MTKLITNPDVGKDCVMKKNYSIDILFYKWSMEHGEIGKTNQNALPTVRKKVLKNKSESVLSLSREAKSAPAWMTPKQRVKTEMRQDRHLV